MLHTCWKCTVCGVIKLPLWLCQYFSNSQHAVKLVFLSQSYSNYSHRPNHKSPMPSEHMCISKCVQVYGLNHVTPFPYSIFKTPFFFLTFWRRTIFSRISNVHAISLDPSTVSVCFCPTVFRLTACFRSSSSWKTFFYGSWKNNHYTWVFLKIR